MILNRLVDYYEGKLKKGEAPEAGWEMADAHLAIVLSDEGKVENILPLLKEEIRKIGKKEKTILVPYEFELPLRVIKSSGIKSNFLSDNASYILGYDGKSKPEKNKEKFEDAKKLHLTLLQESSNPSAKALCLFFSQWDIEKAKDNPFIKENIKLIEEGRNMVFLHDGKFIHENPEIRKIWDDYCNNNEGLEEKVCLVSGKKEPIARLHGKIKGLPGAQSAGANLISQNAEAFISYNIKESLPGAPVGKYSAFSYVTAMNMLIADRDRRIMLGDIMLLYWAEDAEEAAADTFSFFFNPPEESDNHKLTEIFKRVDNKLPVSGVSLDKKFYILGIAPNAARVSVSLFIENDFGSILSNIADHYKRLEIRKPSFEKREFLTPYAILNETINKNSKNAKPNPQHVAGLTRAILLGEQYPHALYQAIIQRVRAEQGSRKINYPKAAMIKACLTQYLPKEEREVLKMSLNEESGKKPYILGRLFAVLEEAQQKANPTINTTIKDRYFNSACANPSIAFPQLLKLCQTHLSKIRKESSGTGIYLDKKIQEILGKLNPEDNPFPKSFNLNDQGLFILGYYQQTQSRFIKKEEI